MEYISYQQGEKITLEGMKYFLRVVDNTHDTELETLLKRATIYVQEYLNICLVDCSIKQSQPVADSEYRLFLSNQTNIQVTSWSGSQLSFSQEGDIITIDGAQPVHITYDCQADAMAENYATLVYQVAGAIYDGEPNNISIILKHYPVC